MTQKLLLLATVALFTVNVWGQNFTEQVNITTNTDSPISFYNTDNTWQYMQFYWSGNRKAWMGLNPENDFILNKENGGNISLMGANLGIGTHDPICKVHIENSINGELNFLIKNTYGLGTRTFLTSMPDKSVLQTDRDFAISTNGGGWSDKLIVKNNGYVGIGITSPSEKLDIAGSFKLSGTIYQNIETGIRISDLSNKLIFKASSNQTEIHAAGTGGTVIRGDNNDIKLTINDGGNVGIGTTTPDYKLDVLGTIRANEIKVETGWSDFVFEPDYKLRTLGELKSFIQKNGHLPEIPTEAEVKENGISVGEMNAKLLQKIEELTLYIIQLEDRIEKIENNN